MGRGLEGHDVLGALLPGRADKAKVRPCPSLQVERSTCGIHLLPFVDPLVLSELRVEGALLQPAHLKGESWSELLRQRQVFVSRKDRRLFAKILVYTRVSEGSYRTKTQNSHVCKCFCVEKSIKQFSD